MSRLLYRLGRTAARHPWRLIAAWLVVAVAVFGLKASVGGSTSDDFSIPGTEAQQGLDLLKSRFPSAGGGTEGRVVFAVQDGTVTAPAAQRAIEDSLDALAAGEHVVAVSDPFDPRQATVSADGTVAFATVQYDINPPTKAQAEQAEAAIETARGAGVQAELSKSIIQSSEEPSGSEGIGLAVALVVLLIAFGSVIAAGIPIGTALLGIMIGLGLVGVMAGFADVPSISPMLASMIGIGVGIDYALFIVTRHRGYLHDGYSPVEAAAMANATSGTAVLFAGSTVVVALAGLYIAGIPAVAIMGAASAITVAVAMALAVTLLPAFLGLAGTRIDKWHIGRRRSVNAEAHKTLAGRWADHVGGHPWRYAIVSFAALAAIAMPVFAMRTGMADDGTAATNTTERKAYDLVAQGFGQGFNGPLTIVLERADEATVAKVHDAVAATPGIDFTTAPTVNPAGDTTVISAIPATSPQDSRTEDLVHTLRDRVLPDAVGNASAKTYVTGQTAAFIDISERFASRLPLFLAAVVGLSFLLLMAVFRSVVVPLKAAVMNLLSIGAAYGVVVAVFQWGWGNELIGVHSTAPITPFLPMIMFAILFGLSMDYEVFLLSRVREEWVRTGDSHQSVVDGLASTARVITSAALIMISVFAAFLLTPDVQVKMFAIGLSVAVLVDATIVRMVLVPATMALMGDANWWLPRWLDRLLPHVDVEGTGVLAPTPVDEPEEPEEIDEREPAFA